MALSSAVAQQVCTKAEYTLFQEGLARNIKSLDKKTVKTNRVRARKLRDKYRQLGDSQEREARGKQKSRRARSAQGNIQTRRKEQLFAETLERFEKRLATLETTGAQTTSKPVVKTRSAQKPKSGVKKKTTSSSKKKAARITSAAKTTPKKKAASKKASKKK